MKKKVGNLFNKPVVQGNLNEINSNEIHIKTEGGGITLSERKNGNLETISGGNESSVSKLKSRKVCWEVDNTKLTDETFNQLKVLLFEVLKNYPLYSSIHVEYDSSTSDWNKYYGIFVNMPLCTLLISNNYKWQTLFFEEAEDIENHYDGLMGLFKTMNPSITEEMVYEMVSLKRIPYEEYIALRVDQEKGKDYIQ